MKANAPERIYLQKYDYDTLLCLNKWNIHEEWTVKPCNEKIATNIEYTRTDAFIEKACEWLSQTDFCHYYNKEFIDDFRKAMEE